MTTRHILLAGCAVAVLGMGVYLVLEVGRAPAAALAEPRAERDLDRMGEPAPAVPSRWVPKQTATDSPTSNTVPQRPQGGGRTLDVPAPGEVVAEPAPELPLRATPKLDAVMTEANKAYDRGDLDEAKSIANKVLATAPGNVRMLRILVSIACLEGEQGEAQKHYGLLPSADRQQMRTRCDRYGMTFSEQ